MVPAFLPLSLLVFLAWTSSTHGDEKGPRIASPRKLATVSAPIHCIASCLNSNILFTSGNQAFVLNGNYSEVNRIRTELDVILDIATTKNEIVFAGGNPGEHGMIEVRGRSNLQLLKRKLIHSDVVYRAQVSNNRLLTASADQTIEIRSLNDFALVRKYTGHSRMVTALAALNVDNRVVSGGLDHTLRIWDSSTGKTIRTLTHHLDEVVDIQKKPEDIKDALPMVASISLDRTVRFWQPTIGRMVRFRKLDSVPATCCWIPGTSKLLVGTEEGDLLEIDSQTLKTVAGPNLSQPITSFHAFDSSRILVGTSRDLWLVDWNR